MVARSEGHIVSFNVAPATRTISVIKNKQVRVSSFHLGNFFFDHFFIFFFLVLLGL